MSIYKFSGNVTKDYEVIIEPRNGGFDLDNIQYDVMKSITGNGIDEPEEYTLNRVAIKGDKLIAYATVKHGFEENSEGVDIDAAESRLLERGDVVEDINKTHTGRYLIEIDEVEMVS